MTSTLKKLNQLSLQARDTGDGEYNHLMEFLNDYAPSDLSESETLEFLVAICNQFIEAAGHIKNELNSIREKS